MAESERIEAAGIERGPVHRLPIERFQEKWKPVFRPKTRQTKDS
jgi:hypothetical protein